jgi:hypothetical protein
VSGNSDAFSPVETVGTSCPVTGQLNTSRATTANRGLADNNAMPETTLLDAEKERATRPCGDPVRRAIEAVGANLLYLPPYSLDFNPSKTPWPS